MDEEKYRSSCCESGFTEYNNEQSTNEASYRCNQCQRICDVVQVCGYCMGTKEIITDERDEAGNVAKGVVSKKCTHC